MNNKKDKQSKKTKKQDQQQVNDLDDPRFASVHTDHRFKKVQKKQVKVKIDKRFQKMFDKDFEIEDEAPVDQYGRKNKKSRKERLTDLYYVDDDNDGNPKSNTTEDKLERLNRLARGEVSLSESSSSESSSEEEDDENEKDNQQDDKQKIKKKNKKEEISEEEEEEEEEDDEREEIPMGDVTLRIGLVNLDWDHIRAVDIFAVLNSFCKRGDIKSVTIYPSDYGIKKIKEENEYGPEGKIVYENPNDLKDDNTKKHKNSEDSDDDDDDESDEELDFDKDIEELENPEEAQKHENIKLRKYEKQRLKYYFAVVECNSLEASSSIYDQCDGFEYLQSGNIFDMRYIPDDISFDDREIKDKTTDVPENYEPIDFTTSALEHTKVKLTWDEEDEEKKKVLLKWGNMNLQDIENDFSNYIGSDSSSDESDIEEKKSKYASLLKDIHKNYDDSDDEDEEGNDNKKDVGDNDEEESGKKEIKFVPSLSKKIEDKIKSKFEDKDKSIYDKYLEKRKLTRKERRKQKEEEKQNKNKDISSTIDPDDEFFDWSKIDEIRNKENEEENELHNNQSESKKSRKKKITKKPETEEEKKSKAKLELLMDESDDDNKNYDMNDILIVDQKKKNKIRKHTDEFHLQEGFEIDTSDPRFAGLYKSSEYHIDPTDPHFKATENMKKLVEEVHKKRHNNNKDDDDDKKDDNMNKKNKEISQKKELEFLAQTVKRKVSQSLNENKTKNKKQKMNKKD